MTVNKKNQVSNHEIRITTCYRPTIGFIYQNNMIFEEGTLKFAIIISLHNHYTVTVHATHFICLI